MAQPGWGHRQVGESGGQVNQVADPVPELLRVPGISLLAERRAALG